MFCRKPTFIVPSVFLIVRLYFSEFLRDPSRKGSFSKDESENATSNSSAYDHFIFENSSIKSAACAWDLVTFQLTSEIDSYLRYSAGRKYNFRLGLIHLTRCGRLIEPNDTVQQSKNGT